MVDILFDSEENVEIETEGETYSYKLRKAPSPTPSDGDGAKPPKNLNKLFWFFGTVVLTVLTTFGVSLFEDTITKTREDAVVQTKVNNHHADIEELKKEVSELRKEIYQTKQNKTQKDNSSTRDRLESSDGIMPGYIGSIGFIESSEIVSSFGVPYYIDSHICETNSQYDGWAEIDFLPSLGTFFEITSASNLKTWVMVIGSFDDAKHTKRAMIVSKVVSDLLVSKKKILRPSCQIRKMIKSEIATNQECLKTLSRYGLTLSDVN